MSYIEATDTSLRKTGQIKLHGPSGFAGMRKAGALVAKCLDELTDIVKPGVPTSQIDEFVRDFAFSHGAYPATLMYRGYRYSTCTSINHVVCHGMPGDRVLKEGDIVNIDVTFIVDGWYGDSSRMYAVGPIARKAERLIEVTYEAMMRGIAAVKPGATTGDIGHAIQSFVEPQGMSVVRDFCGHGLGRMFHDEPNIIHIGRPGEGVVLKPGMFFTIEPMINLGKPHVKILSDGWTAVTRDRSLSAQFEHSVGVTATGVEIFTLSQRHAEKPPVSGIGSARAASRQRHFTVAKPDRHGMLSADARENQRTARSAHRDAALSRPSRAAARALSRRRARRAERLRTAGDGAVQRPAPGRHQAAGQDADQEIRLVRRGHSCAGSAAARGRGNWRQDDHRAQADRRGRKPHRQGRAEAAHRAVVME